MTEDKFTELVNLYLDKEISECGLAQLKSELAANAKRKYDFVRRCRMHQAMRMALNPQLPKRSYKFWRYRSNSSSHNSHSNQRSQRTFSNTSRRADSISTREISTNQFSHKVITFPRWIMGAGFAASLALSFALIMLAFRDTPAVSSQATLKGVEVEDLYEVDMLERIGNQEIRSFVNLQAQRKANQQASLAAQHQLLRLSPELTPMKKQLRFMSVATAQRLKVVRDDSELMADVQKMSFMASPQILRVESMQSEPSASWPEGFRSSLASFK